MSERWTTLISRIGASVSPTFSVSCYVFPIRSEYAGEQSGLLTLRQAPQPFKTRFNEASSCVTAYKCRWGDPIVFGISWVYQCNTLISLVLLFRKGGVHGTRPTSSVAWSTGWTLCPPEGTMGSTCCLSSMGTRISAGPGVSKT
jgi:hypothetical protein